MIKYPSLENHYREKYIHQCKLADQEVGGLTWYATEKIHGANMQVFFPEGSLEPVYGSRNRWLTPKESFNNYQSVFSGTLLEDLKNAVQEIREILCDSSAIAFFGEIFGGYYQGVDKVPGAKQVNKGVQYAPHNDFLIFDIRINEDQWLSYPEIQALESLPEKRLVPLFFKGTLDECLALDNALPSKVYQIYGLPAIEGNIIEGVVVKPERTLRDKFGHRLAIKSKNSVFSEKAHGPKKPSVPQGEHPLLNELSTYINRNRVEAVLSKEGGVSLKDMGRLIGLVSQDVIEDAVKDSVLPEDYKSVDGWKALNKQMSKLIVNVLKEVL